MVTDNNNMTSVIRNKSFITNWYFKNPAYAFYPTYGRLMRPNRKRRAVIAAAAAAAASADATIPVTSTNHHQHRASTYPNNHSSNGTNTYNCRSVEPINCGNSKLVIIFAALFVIALALAIAAIVSWAIFTDGFANFTGDPPPCTPLAAASDFLSSSTYLPPTASSTPSIVTINRQSISPPSSSHNIPSSNRSACVHQHCVRIAANYLNNMNDAVSPCTDFYEYACGRFSHGRTVPESEKKLTILTEMRNNVDRQLKDVLELPARANQTDSARLVQVFYASCIDEQAQIEQDSLPMNALISQLGGWPLIQNAKFDDANYNWEMQAGQLALIGIGAVFRLLVHNDLIDNGKMMLMFGPPNLLLGHKRYYMNGSDSLHLRAYKQYMLELVEHLGADQEAVEEALQNVIEFEIQLANLTNADVGRNQSALNNPMSFGELKRRFDTIQWDLFFNDELQRILVPLDDQQIINVIDIDYFIRLGPLLSNTRLQTIADYVMWKLVSNFDIFMPRTYRQPYQNLREKIIGAGRKPNWHKCISDIKSLLSWPIASVYAEKYFNVDSKKRALELIADLKLAMEQALLSAEWMDEATRELALTKLTKMGHKIGFPDYLFNQTRILQAYAGVRLAANTYFDNALVLKRALTRRLLFKVREPIDRDEWITPVIAVDAFHYFNGNEIIFPAGILQFPMFIPTAPSYVNYGSIGMGIGHEITHGYDDLGAQYDGNGNMRRWWNAQTMRVFNSKKQCFIAQYTSKQEPITGRKLDGKLTIGENIADNGGLRVAYNVCERAYQLLMARMARQQEASLPGMAHFTSDQMFFIAFANTWCEMAKPQAIEHIIETDAHSIGMFRVNVPLQNLPAFSRAFDCPIGSQMNPYEKCRIW